MAVNRFENSSAEVNVQIGSADGDVSVVLDRPTYRLEALSPISRPRVPKSQRSPSFLLDARREVVPFRDRAERQVLAAWLADEEPASVLVASGPGGIGKTRLANQVATGALRDGWAVMRAVERPGPPRAAARTGGPTPEGKILVVADYAERWPLPVLTTLIEDLCVDYADHVVRVLMLARPERGFWESMRAELGRSGADLPAPVEMGAFTTTADDTAEAYTRAVHAFQEELGYPLRVLPAPQASWPDPLSLHMQALAAVCADAEGGPLPDATELSAYLLDHERRHWGSSGLPAGVPESLVLVATLFGPFTAVQEGRQWVMRARLADGEAAAGRLLEGHHRLYPPLVVPTRADWSVAALPEAAGEVLIPLMPDRLAEDFITEQLRQPAARELVASLLAAAPGTARAAVRRCLGTLASASRYPHVRSVLFDLLRNHAELSGAAPPSVLYTVLEHGDRDLIEAVDDALPPFTAGLVRPARDIARHLADTLPLGAPVAHRAVRLARLSTRLAAAGDNLEALEVGRDAVDAYQRLPEPGHTAYLPHLAVALNNLGIAEMSVGSLAAAQAFAGAAVSLSRQLAEADPAHQPRLAMALTNLSAAALRGGNPDTALQAAKQAVDVYRSLCADAAHHPGLATALTNLSAVAAQAGASEEGLAAARQAVDAYRPLADADPAHQPGLAAALTNLSAASHEDGDMKAAREHAQESLTNTRRMADAEPGVYAPVLVLALNNLDVLLSEAGDEGAALDLAQESMTIRRRLAKADPTTHLPGLAQALSSLGIRLAKAGRHQAALATTQECVGTYIELLNKTSDLTYMHDLSTVVSRYAWMQLQADGLWATQVEETSNKAFDLDRHYDYDERVDGR